MITQEQAKAFGFKEKFPWLWELEPPVNFESDAYFEYGPRDGTIDAVCSDGGAKFMIRSGISDIDTFKKLYAAIFDEDPIESL
jgi:hypothetical protein